jgi:hypothetical protein
MIFFEFLRTCASMSKSEQVEKEKSKAEPELQDLSKKLPV